MVVSRGRASVLMMQSPSVFISWVFFSLLILFAARLSPLGGKDGFGQCQDPTVLSAYYLRKRETLPGAKGDAYQSTLGHEPLLASITVAWGMDYSRDNTPV